MAWILVPCLVSLRNEFNRVNPTRDKGADGSIGDSAHTSSSDHTPDEDSDILRDHDADSKNEVHALDIDSTGPWPKAGWFAAAVLGIVAREKKRWLDPNDVCRLEYAIWDGHIYSRAYDFAKRVYSGDDQHTNHAHFSSRYLTTAENDTSPWGVGGFLMGIFDNEADYKAYHESLQAPTTKAVRSLLTGEPALISGPVESLLAGNTDLLGDAIRALLWDAVHAKRVEVVATDGTISYATGRDAVYDAATPARQKEMRNTLQLLQELGMAVKGTPALPQG